MLGPPAASIPRQGDGEPDRRGGQRQLEQDRLPHGQQPVQAGGDVHRSNQVSASNSAAPALAGIAARGLPRVSKVAVSSAATADAGIIEEVTERAHGRERCWRTIAVDRREHGRQDARPGRG